MRVLRVMPPLEAYAIMIDMGMVHGPPTSPVALIEEMLVDGVRPPRSLLQTVLAHCRRYDLHDAARLVALELERAGGAEGGSGDDTVRADRAPAAPQPPPLQHGSDSTATATADAASAAAAAGRRQRTAAAVASEDRPAARVRRASAERTAPRTRSPGR
jgi:hypothetical protein